MADLSAVLREDTSVLSYFSLHKIFWLAAGLVLFDHVRRTYDHYRFEKELLLSEVPFLMFLIKLLCLKPLSIAWGYLMDLTVPLWARSSLYSAFAYVTGINLTEVAQELSHYQTLNELFTRDLKPHSRSIDPAILVSPADALVTDLQTINIKELREQLEAQGTLAQDAVCDAIFEHIRLSKVKDCCYIVADFLGLDRCPLEQGLKYRSKSANAKEDNFHPLSKDEQTTSSRLGFINMLPDKIEQLSYITLYLFYGDCHQFFYPTHFNMSQIQHFSGELMPVSPTFLKFICPGLPLNERVLCMGLWEMGRFSMTLVGATNVGRIKVFGDQSQSYSQGHADIYNTTPTRPDVTLSAKTPMQCAKGEKMGYFEMGSSIVLIFESKDFEFLVKANDRVQIGQALGRRAVLQK